MNWRNLKIRVSGSSKKIKETEDMLDKVELTGTESKDRLILQNFIDENKIKTSILYDGNTIISYDKIINEYKRILTKNEFNKMSDYFYNFLSLDCGSIAHYDKNGWLYEYYNLEKLKHFFMCNEFGKDIVRDQPTWKTDVIKIGETILELTNKHSHKQESIQEKKKKEEKQLNMFSMIA